MASLNLLKKQELLDLIQQHNLTVSTKMTKSQIISVLKEHSITGTEHPTNNQKTANSMVKTKKNSPLKDSVSSLKVEQSTVRPIPSKKVNITPPTKTIDLSFNNNITVLMQSHDKALIIWNADPSNDHLIKAWKFQNEYGLDILVPNYARSIFVDLSMFHTLKFSLYQITCDDSKILFHTYHHKGSNTHSSSHQSLLNQHNIPESELKQILDKHWDEYYSSHQHFSSDQHFLL